MATSLMSYGDLSNTVAPLWFTRGIQQLKSELSQEFDQKIERLLLALKRSSIDEDIFYPESPRTNQRELTNRLLSELDAAINCNDCGDQEYEINSIKNKLVTLK